MTALAVRVEELCEVFDVPEREAGLKAATKSCCFWLVVSTSSFWFVRVEHVLHLFKGLDETGRRSVGIYPDRLRFSVTFLVPIAVAVTVPAEAVTSRLDWQTLLFAVVFAVALFAFTRWFRRVGLPNGTGASA